MKEEKNIYRLFVTETGQGLRFGAWKYNRKKKKELKAKLKTEANLR